MHGKSAVGPMVWEEGGDILVLEALETACSIARQTNPLTSFSIWANNSTKKSSVVGASN
jgi:hypothetical protein